MAPTDATRSFKAKHEAIYASDRDCARYDAEICRRQDHAGALLATLRPLVSLTPSTRVGDIGAGTGKLARLLAPHVGSVACFDRSAEALVIARAAHEQEAGGGAACSCSFEVADLRQLPLADGSLDLVVAGWSLSYLKSEHEEWYADGSYGGAWREEVDAALAEMDRVLAEGGVAVVLETQGTAADTPRRAGSHLYAHFRECGFEESLVRTDYRFPSRREAVEQLRFFFGKGTANRAEAMLGAAAAGSEDDGAVVVPECTGLWWRRRECRAGTDGRAAEGQTKEQQALAKRIKKE